MIDSTTINYLGHKENTRERPRWETSRDCLGDCCLHTNSMGAQCKTSKSSDGHRCHELGLHDFGEHHLIMVGCTWSVSWDVRDVTWQQEMDCHGWAKMFTLWELTNNLFGQHIMSGDVL